MKFLCVCRRDGSNMGSKIVDAPNAIEAIREATTDTGWSGQWTAYTEVVTKDVVIERRHVQTVTFKDPS